MGNLKIKEALKLKGITAKQMAGIIGVSEGTFSGYANGEHEPKSDTLVTIAKTCGVSLDYLLGITNTPYANKSPEPVNKDPENGEIVKAASRIYNALLSAGYVKEGQELTPEQIKFLDALASACATFFNDGSNQL